ncbi:MAG: LacI family transcriptional regulator [Clostridiaceae bacterium]|nr:LacI family transcriptional regulator [Clostridiaceae bacterium]
MITLKEIAQICDVSISTVSNILNGKPNVSEETRQRVLEVVNQTGYKPNYFAQGIRKQKTKIIGIIVEDLNLFSTTPIVGAIMAYCEELDYRTILINMRLYDKWQDTWYNDEQKFNSVLQPSIKELLSIKVDGIVYVAGHCRVINCFPDDFKIPGIVVYGISNSPKFTSVVIDDKKGGYDITKYLISMGHRKIGVIAGTPDNLHTMRRILGYQKALFEEEILYNPDFVRYGDWMRPSGYREAESLIKEGVSAIFCMNDLMAVGLYDYLYEKGIQVGEDISVVGYDNKEISECIRPGLTTNEIQLEKIGQEAAKIMIKMLEEDYVASKSQEIIKIPCRLIIRESVKKNQ